MSGETGENPVLARSREVQKRDSSYQKPHFEKEPLGKPEKADETVPSRNIRTQNPQPRTASAGILRK